MADVMIFYEMRLIRSSTAQSDEIHACMFCNVDKHDYTIKASYMILDTYVYWVAFRDDHFCMHYDVSIHAIAICLSVPTSYQDAFVASCS